MMDRPLRTPSAARAVTALSGRARNLERRFQKTVDIVPYFQIEQAVTLNIPEDTITGDLDIGTPGQDVVTNDIGGGGLGFGVPEPIDGDYFAIDLSIDATKFTLVKPGLYLVSRAFAIVAIDESALVSGTQYIMALNMYGTGIPGAGFMLGPNGTTIARSVGGSNTASDDSPFVHSYVVYNASTTDVTIAIRHQGHEGDITQFTTDLGAIYLGAVA